MVQCPQCQSVLFVDISGNIVVGGTELSTDEPPLLLDENSNPFQQQDLASSDVDGEQEEAVLGFPFDTPAERENSIASEKEDTDVGEIELTKNEYSEVRAIESDALEAPFWDQSGNIAQGNSENLSNQSHEVSDAIPPAFQMGSMNYKIHIKGIDSFNIRQSVLSALRDKRLGLVSDEIAEKIDQGELTIMGLNPVKASVIMNTLKDLPFEISWELYGKEESSAE